MNEDALFTALLIITYTKPDMLRRLRMIREYMEYKFFSNRENANLDGYLRDNAIVGPDAAALMSLGEEFFLAFTKANAYAYINALVDRVNLYPVMTVYIPFDPTYDDVVKLGVWFRDEVDKTIIMELHVEPRLLGGCAFSYKGIYKEYSLMYYLKKKRQDISQMLNGYVNASQS
jgi:hypothetical protein